MMASGPVVEKQCTPKCRSRQHVDQIISQISKLSLAEFQAFSSLCHNWSRYPDLLGRVAVHVAASCRNTEVLAWLLDQEKVDLAVKDAESGYTALHRAIYYGQVAAAKMLIQYDSALQACDHEGLTPLDVATLDRPDFISYSISEPNEIWTWGENMNMILGHHDTHRRTHPEVVAEFTQQGLAIKQVVVSKYHSVFLTLDGRVFTCGNGQGGRLGHGDQHFVLTPKMVEAIKKQTCVGIAAGTDHTLMRMRRGVVLSCGLNSCHQLGQGPDQDGQSCLQPRPMKSKFLKKKPVLGVCAGRFHSVVWASDEIYTVGLNAGQLGHPKGEKCIDQLQPVPSLRSSTGLEIVAVSCSDAATACLTAKGHVFVMHEYTCRRIPLRLSGIEHLAMTGGCLDSHVCSDLLMEKGGHELVLVLRSKWGQIYVWRGSSPSVRRCRWKMRRQLSVTDVSVNEAGLLVTTSQGQAYVGKLSDRKSGVSNLIKESPKDTYKLGGDVAKQGRLLDHVLKEDVQEVTATRVPGVHRGLAVASDPRGRNFGVIQALPNGCLFKFPCVSPSSMNDDIGRLRVEGDEDDTLHDAIIQVGDRRWPVHGYIISTRSGFFQTAFRRLTSQSDDDAMPPGPAVIQVDGLTPDLMDQIVQYMYTDTCDLLTPGYQVKLDLVMPRKSVVGTGHKEVPETKMENNGGLNGDCLGRQESDLQGVREPKPPKPKKGKGRDGLQSKNPVKMFQEAARTLGIQGLVDRLNQVRCSDGVISVETPLAKDTFCFDRLKFSGLSDTTIVTADNTEVACHKCILAARLEYFHSMFATGWVESRGMTRLSFPVSEEALTILIDFLYTDQAPRLVDCSDTSLLYDVLALSDQLLSKGLKELCEVALANLVSFKNVSEFLELSSVYNAHQLKDTCHQFVCFNLPAVLEARILEVSSDETLQELTDAYRATIPSVGYRMMSAPSHPLDRTFLARLVCDFHTPTDDGRLPSPESTGKRSRLRVAKRVKSGVSECEGHPRPPSVSRRKGRQVSVCSDVSVKSLEDVAMATVEQHVDGDNRIQAAGLVGQKQSPKTTGTPKAPTVVVMGTPTPTPAPTSPVDVPGRTRAMRTLSWTDNNNTNNNNNNTKNGAAPQSPTPPTPPTGSSLRDIMRQEMETTVMGLKQSRQAAKRKESRRQTKKDTPAPAVSRSPICPWGASSGVVSSFRALMLEDRGEHSHQQDAAGDRTEHPPMPVSERRPAPSPIPKSRAAQAWPKGDNPWPSPPVTPTSPPPPLFPSKVKVNFSDILQDEIEKEVTLVKMRQKPLTLIQVEERAMQELLHHYGATDREQDFVTVERVYRRLVATPVWHRD